MALSKWTPTTNLMMLRRMGKMTEELGELQAVAARCIIQGINEIDPGSGKVNRVRLEDEIADVMAQCLCTIDAFNLDDARISRRVMEKRRLMAEWEAMFKDDPAQPAAAEPLIAESVEVSRPGAAIRVTEHRLTDAGRAALTAAEIAQPAVPEPPPLPAGEVMASGMVGGEFVSLVCYSKADIHRRDKWWQQQVRMAAIERERDQLRAAQAVAVMPLIGPLCDAWDGMPNDTKATVRDEAPGLAKALGAIGRAMEADAPAALPAAQQPSDPTISTREWRIPVQLPDGRIVMVRKCDLRGNDMVAFIDGDTLPPHDPASADDIHPCFTENDQ